MDSPKYALTPNFERRVAILSAQSSSFWHRAGQHVEPPKLSDPLCALVVATVREFRTHPGSMIPVLQALLTKVDAGSLKRAVYDAIEELHLDIDVGPAEEEPILETLVPILQTDRKQAIVERVVASYGTGDIDAARTVADFERIEAIGTAHRGSETITLDDADIDAAYAYSEGEKLSLGVPQLDVVLGGGAEIGSLSVFVANPGQGKSIVLLNAGVCAVLEGYNVFYLSTELDKPAIITRFVQNLCDMTISEIQANRDEARKRIAYWKARGMGTFRFSKQDADECTPAMARDLLRNAAREDNLAYRVFIVDYADELASGVRYSKDDAQASKTHTNAKVVYGKLRAIAGEINGWCLTASQPKGGNDGKASMDLDSLGGSIAKIQKADNVVTIPRTEDDKAKEMFRFQIRKRRLKAVAAGTANMGPYPSQLDFGRPCIIRRDAPWNRDPQAHAIPDASRLT